jgi:hypothetical protein
MQVFYIFLISMVSSCFSAGPAVNASGTIPNDGAAWTLLLKKHVSESGKVNYKGFIKDSLELNTFLSALSHNPPDTKTWSKEAQLAYWINAYNAYTVQLVLRHYPLKSIKEIGSRIQIPFVNTPWDLKFITIGKNLYDLNNLEHGILRKFGEPRIHFAINCASFSCPKLRNEAYTAARLNEQLDDQAKMYINNPAVNSISEHEAQVSKLFSWFSGDFETFGQTVSDFINLYSKVKITKNTKVSYKDYNWNLNE